jgi:mannitol/fructose-specific phosphotransferase system IIA component (Ntr-type)
MDSADKIRSIRALADQMEGLAANLRDACEAFVSNVETEGESAAMPGVDATVNRIVVVLGRLTSISQPSVSGADRSRCRSVSPALVTVAPPLEVSNQYLPVLGKIAQFANKPDVPERLSTLKSADDFFSLLEEKGV